MKKIIMVAALCVIIPILAGCTSSQAGDAVNGRPGVMAGQGVDKVEVVHFHGAQQCWSCRTVGEYALKTVKTKFPEEYKNNKIIFRDINYELPANREIVIKYQARGSSLFVNGVKDGQDNIKEDVTVWRLIGNENQFMNYFEAELKKLLEN